MCIIFSRNISSVGTARGIIGKSISGRPVYTRSTARAYTSKCTAVVLCIAPKGVAMRNPCNGSLSHEFMRVAAGSENRDTFDRYSTRERQAFSAPLKCFRRFPELTTVMKYENQRRHGTPAILF